MKWLVRNPKYSIPGGLALLAGLAWLAFGFFGVHLLLVDDKVAEPIPSFVAPTTQPAQTPAAEAVTTIVPPSDSSTPTTAPVVSAEPAASTSPAPAIVTEYRGTFVGRNHPTSGNAIVLGDGSGQRFVRFETFETDNGPDLNVYLVNSAAGGVDDFIDLGNLKGNIGDQNYEIPADVDLAVYDTVLIWCVRFSSAFGEAALMPA